eukprot:gene18426-26453_t
MVLRAVDDMPVSTLQEFTASTAESTQIDLHFDDGGEEEGEQGRGAAAPL